MSTPGKERREAFGIRDEEKEQFINDLYKANNILGMSLLVASLTAVLLAMVIYSCFVTLQCMRVTLIKNFLVAILFQEHITLVLQALVYFARNERLPDIRCLFRNTSFCEALIASSKYFELTALCWLAVISYNQWCRSKPKLNNRFNFLTIFLIGWITPILPTAVWVGLMAHKDESDATKCWPGHNSKAEIAILEGSKLLFILIALGFLSLNYFNLYHGREIINVEEVLKQRTESHMASCVWFWFTLAHVVYVSATHAQYHPLDFRSMTAWSYILTVLLSSGGLVAATCFCFVDQDVREMLKSYKP
ncbi:calcitonin receptor-like protein 1 [Littorina saxatilis]|uniref:G-protein coupled receptors family 2 profile 2 domain-containing protein n=1 Tax=Littorina saxatilis TaxID=31220 RepID=A0AAN9AVG5_9CAEN